MRIIDPQSAALTNVEVLAYLTTNPPRRPPNPPPNARHWVPSPDLRDHNTVVKEIHNYVHRLSPHLLTYPPYVHGEPPHQNQYQDSFKNEEKKVEDEKEAKQEDGGQLERSRPLQPLHPQSNTPTPMEAALRSLISQLMPFGLTKAEVLMIVNLGVGLGVGESRPGEEAGGGGEAEEGREGGRHVNGEGMDVDVADGEGNAEEAGEEGAEEDYGPLALLDTVIEEREERLSKEDARQILRIIRETLGAAGGPTGAGVGDGG